MQIKRFSIIQIAIFLKGIYRTNITTKIPAAYFAEIVKLILKSVCKCKRPKIDNLKTKQKQNKDGDPILCHFKTYYIATVIWSVVLAYQSTYRSMEWNEESEN